MNVLSLSYELIVDAPVHHAPAVPFVDLHLLVPYLLDLYPTWSLEDVEAFVEEKTRQPLHPEDRISLSAIYQRCVRLRREFEE